jgi:hypothetical protein
VLRMHHGTISRDLWALIIWGEIGVSAISPPGFVVETAFGSENTFAVLFTLTPQSPNNVYNFCKFGPFSYPSYRNDLIDDRNKSVGPIFNISKTDEVIKFCPVQIWGTGATCLLR